MQPLRDPSRAAVQRPLLQTLPRSTQAYTTATSSHSQRWVHAAAGWPAHSCCRQQRRRRRSTAVPAAAALPAAASCSLLPQLPEGWPLWTAFAVCGALGQVVERRTPLGAVLSAPLVSMLLALAAAAAGLLPTASAAADAIWAFLMPLGAACYLLESDLSQLISSAGATLAAFVVGAAGTLLGTLIAFRLVGPHLGPDGWKIAAALCASYIGGSVNFAAVSQALALGTGPLLAGAMAADNCIMALYIACIMSIPAAAGSGISSSSKGRRLHTASEQQRGGADAALSSGGGGNDGGSISSVQAVTAESVALSLAAAALACCLGNHLAAAANSASSALAVMAVLASCLGSLGSRLAARAGVAGRGGGQQPSPFAGAESLGGALMMLFFATIGASAGSLQALRGCGWLVLFILLQLSIHLAVCLAGGRLLRLPMQAVLIASNANVGGPATAAAMASAKGWPHMVQPAMLTGALGYAIATAIGIAMGGWLKTWF